MDVSESECEIVSGPGVDGDIGESRVEGVSMGGVPGDSGVEGKGGNPEESGAKGDIVGGDLGASGGEGERRVSVERVGALEPCGDLILIATGEQLYVPVTQVGM